MRILRVAVGIISWPIAKVLDWVLGKEHSVSSMSGVWAHVQWQPHVSRQRHTGTIGSAGGAGSPAAALECLHLTKPAAIKSGVPP